jgi:ribose transport system ATP-binding protein
MAIDFNITLATLPRLSRVGLYYRRASEKLAGQFQKKLRIAASDLNRRAATLSGGNQQKVVLAKWLAVEPAVLILDEPTRGVDVGSKSDIYELIFELAARGMAIMLISSEMEEVIGISDRIAVMHEGRIEGELTGAHMTESSVMELAIGTPV